jgi:hypothetical protein
LPESGLAFETEDAGAQDGQAAERGLAGKRSFAMFLAEFFELDGETGLHVQTIAELTGNILVAGACRVAVDFLQKKEIGRTAGHLRQERIEVSAVMDVPGGDTQSLAVDGGSEREGEQDKEFHERREASIPSRQKYQPQTPKRANG